MMDTKGFIDQGNALTERQRYLFVLIHNTHKAGISREELAARERHKRLSPRDYMNLQELINCDFVTYENGRYYANEHIRQLVREIHQNRRIAQYLR